MNKDFTYEDLIEVIKNLPMTFYPAVISEAVQAAYEKKVFLPGGASTIIANVEKRIGKSKPEEK